MRVLITGVTGFAGGHLAAYLRTLKGVELFGLSRSGVKKKPLKDIRVLRCDIRDGVDLARVVKRVKPHRVFHLAAFSSVGQSWKAPDEAFESNVNGTRFLLEAVRKHSPQARVHVAGSAEVYGKNPGVCRRLKETAPLRPMNPYAVSKVAQEMLARQYSVGHRLHVVLTRAFNHIGPGQSSIFVTADFARQVASIETGRQRPVIEVGNLSARRDFSDVRDVVRAYWSCLEKGVPGEVYNVCSGNARPVTDILRYYLSHTAVRIMVRKDRARFRSVDAPLLAGDPAKLKARTGWKPVFKLESTLEEVLAFWRKKIGRER